MSKRSIDDVLAQLPEWEESSDEECEPTEEDLVAKGLNEVQAKIKQTEQQLAILVKERDLLLAKMDKIPGARYEPSSPTFSPTSPNYNPV